MTSYQFFQDGGHGVASG